MDTNKETDITKREDLKKFLKETPYEITILKFSASWCGPCRKIKPFIDELLKNYEGYNFKYIEIDVDKEPLLYSSFKRYKMINGIPSMFFYRKCDYNDDTFYVPYATITGADKTSIEHAFKTLLNK
jgi:thiol-disulfide isomerase/thioredoxin